MTAANCAAVRNCIARLPIPMSFEPNLGQFDKRAKFAGRGAGMTLLLTSSGIDVALADKGTSGGAPRFDFVRVRFGWAAADGDREVGARFSWRGQRPLKTVSNYFIGNDPRAWRTNVPHFARAAGKSVHGQRMGIAIYGTRAGVEYDLRLAPGENTRNLRMRFFGASHARISSGDLILDADGRELRMGKPHIYEELAGIRRPVGGGYAIESDGSVGLHLGPHDPRATLVVDPSLSVAYATFLGGAGNETAGNVAIDASGKVYVSGVTTSATTFPETSAASIGPVPGVSAFYIAKIDPTVTGASSLIYLTFLGGSGTQTGGLIALDGAGDVALTGTTTSTDFPVTGSSQPTQGLTSGSGNDAIVSEIIAAGNHLNFSSYFGGSGTISANGTGGIAVDSTGNVYIASDAEQGSTNTASPDLPVTANAYQPQWDGQYSDGFLAVFAPPATAGGASALSYCTYLGTNAQAVAIGGVAVDSNGNAYIGGTAFSGSGAGFGFPAQGAFQSTYGGGASDGFVMKIAPKGQSEADLVYATLLGGSGADEVLSIALDTSLAPKAYVTGETQSPDFPVTLATAYQTKLNASRVVSGSSNAFLAAVAQDPVSARTSVAYSSYLGGSGTDAGLSIAVAAPSSVYVAGSTDSADFPWRDNLQPFNGSGDAFLAKFDPTSSGAASLAYSTPLAGTSPPGGIATTAASGVAASSTGQVYITGQTTAADFPTAVTTSATLNGFQQSCASCGESVPSSDAFIAAISEGSAAEPSVYFNEASENFGASDLGTVLAGQPVAVLNGGEQNLTISDIEVLGPNSGDFSTSGQGACIGTSIPPGPTPHCSMDVNFTPSVGGPEVAFLAVTDNAPGSPQLLEMKGTGDAAHAQVLPASVSFGNQPVNTTSAGQTITVTNTGNETLTIAQNGFSPTGGPFRAGAISCPSLNTQWTLSPGASCTMQILFAPTATGLAEGQLQFTDNSDSQSSAQQVVMLSGTGALPKPLAQISPPALTFGSTLVGATSASQSVTLQNQGSAALDLSAIAIGGANAPDFEIATSGTTCPISGGTVAVGGQCTVAVQFAPQSSGASKTATLTFTDNANPSTQAETLNGSAASPASITVSPGSLAFGGQSEGTASAAQIVTITNSGTGSAGISGIAISGSADFVQSNACPPVLGAGAQCQVSVTFEPAESGAAGARSATLKVPGGTPSSVALSGTATLAAASFTTNVNFASQLVGTTGAAQPITITNTSSGALAGALAFTGISISGTNRGDFSITANQCSASGGAGIAPGGSCTVNVAFQPQAAGTCGDGPNRSAALQLQDNAPGSPQTISLSGAAADFCLASSGGQPLTTPTQPGQTASYSMEVASAGGFAGTVNLSCSVAPATAEIGPCALTTSPASNPASVQVRPTAAGQFTVNVPTVAPSAGRMFGRPKGFGRGAEVLMAGCLWLAFLFWWVLAVSEGRPGVRRLRAVRLIQIGALGVALVLAIAGCGSGSGGGSDPVSDPGTPPGTYTITITASTMMGGSSTTRTASLTLTVQPPSG